MSLDLLNFYFYWKILPQNEKLKKKIHFETRIYQRFTDHALGIWFWIQYQKYHTLIYFFMAQILILKGSILVTFYNREETSWWVNDSLKWCPWECHQVWHWSPVAESLLRWSQDVYFSNRSCIPSISTTLNYSATSFFGDFIPTKQ